MKFEGISVDDILANSKPEAVEQEAQINAEKTGLDFSSVGVDSLIADRDQQSLDATSAVTAKAPDLANRERMIAEKMETTRIDAEYNLEALEKQNESNEIGKVLSEAPTLTNHLANNPANAPILRNDLGTLRDIEKSLGKFGLEIDESGDIDLLAEAETGWQAAREDVVENATVGFASGKAIGDQGILWAKIRDQGLEITEELKKVSESYEQKINGMNDRDSFIADAAQIVGTMTSAFLNSANETAALSGGVVAAGMATGIGAPVASTVAGAMVVGGSMRAMYDIEGGLAYKEMVEKGADPEKAKLISQGVGLVNSLIEFGGVTLLGKAFGPVMRTLTTKHTAKTAAALSEASMLNLISESSKAMVKSVGAEVATEVMQELVNVAGEGLANEFANAQFDEKTLESVYDRLSEIAIKTAKGMFVLGSLGMAPTIVVGSRKVYEARKAEEFFTALSDGMSKSEAAQVAPEVMAGVVQQMAEDAKTGVVYVDAAELQQVLTDNNVSLDQLEELVPGVKEVLEQKAINKEDIVMPTGQYAAKIAGTDLGKALTPHVRLSENALSVSDAAKLRKEQTAMLKSILEGKVSEEDIDQDILQMTKVSQAEIDKLEAEYDQLKERMKGTKDEERKALQAEAKAMRERIQTVKANMRVGFVAEYETLKTKMFEQIKETGVYNEADAKTNAKYGAWLVTNLARRAGLKPERVAELAPSIGARMFDEGYKAIDTLAMKKRSHDFDEQIKKWRNGDMSELSFDLGEPSWVLQIFGVSKDLPLVAKAAQMFHVLHKKGEKTKINFKNYRGVHGMTDEELKGILVAIQQPIAVFQSASMPDSIVLATELKRRVIEQKVKDKKGNTYLTTVKVIDENSTPQEIAQSVERYVVVPIALRVSADGIEVMNDVSSIYEKNEFPADWFSKYLLGYDAKKGPEFIAQGLGSTSSPTQTGPSSKVIVYQNETSVGDLYQENEEMPRGSFSSSLNSITLTPKADLSTFAHEMGHWYLETLFAIYGETASASVRSDVEVMLKDFGLKSIDEWKALPFKEREVLHERFAFYVEQYLAEGKAPTKETRGFFKRFGAWIRGVYSRFGKGAKEELNNAYRQRFDIELPEMSEEVRRVLDRMLAAESAIKQAEQAEGIVPLFKQKPADMDDGLWEQLMQESDDAYAEATDAAFERMARDEKWYSNARSRKLKEIQQQADEVKNIVRDKVEKELDAKAESKAFNMVKLGGLKMDPELLKKEGFDSVTIDALKKGGLCKRGGMSPTAVRELVRAAKSYHTTKRMIAEFVTLSDREKLVDELVTKRCLRDYSELFNTKKRDAIISKALHNEARGRMVATELSYLANDKEGRSRIYREAARRAAEQMINGMQIGSVSVRKFIAAEARASRKAYEALQSGDRYAAVLAKRAQLVQHEAALMAIEIEQEVRRVKSLKDRIFKADKKLAKTHDIDIINVARYVMTNEGLGKGAPSSGDPSDALKYVEKLKTYDPDKYALFTNFIDKHGYKGNIDFKQYTVSYAMEVLEDAQMLYRMAREAKTLTLDGKRLDREQVVAELVERFEMGNRGEFDGGKGRVISAEGKFTFDWMNLKSRMIRVEQWCHAMDGGQTGPFFNYIFKPIANAAAKYRNLNNKTQEALVTVLKPMVDKWSKVREIEAPEIGYTFATKAELIGAMLHTGNESNKAKLLLGGRGDNHPWARLVELQDGTNFVDTTQWDAFVARVMQRGIITKEDMDVIQQLWDLLESTKPLAQKAFKEMYGTYFDEVEATEVVTPWGNYRGGYVPAITEKYLVPATITNEEANRIIQQNYVSQMPVHQPGFSKSRVPNYTKPLALDVGLLCGHVQEVLKFAVMAPVSQEVAKVIADKRFNEPIEKHDPYLIDQMLKPWLNRAYEQTISDGKTDMVSSKLNQLRGIAGMNIMAGHVVNALQQWTGLSIAATKVNPRYMANALALVVSGKSSPSDVMELSPFMKSRLNNRAFEFQSQIEQIAKTSENVKQAKRLFGKAVALDEKLDAARDWVSRHGYFLQTAMQAPIDTIVWLGAYNQSIDSGMSEEDAIANADSIVRTTQSAFDPENVAEVETGSALYRCFLVFYNYFNMQLNLLGESWEGAKQTKKYGKFALDSMFIVAIPSILSAILGQMLTGFDTGEDDDWDAYDAMRLFIAEPLKNVIAMAPFLGGAITAGGTALANKDVAWAQFVWGEDPYQSRMMSSPAFDALATGGTGLLQWLDAIEGEEYNARSAVRGTLDLLSIVTRLPLGALKKPLGYAAGVASGDIEPESVGEAIRGTLAGKDISK